MRAWLVVVAACGRAVAPTPQQPRAGSAVVPEPPPPEDVVLDLGSATEITARVLVPRVLDTYPIDHLGDVRTLEEMRKVFAQDNYPALQTSAVILATLLHEQQLDEEARQVLARATAVSGAYVDERTLRMLGRFSMLAHDYAGAEKAWEELVTAYPVSHRIDEYLAWWAYTRLAQFHNDDAAALLAQSVPNATPELAYVRAWVKLRAGDTAGAWSSMTVVITALAAQPALMKLRNRDDAAVSEALSFAARSDASLGDIARVVRPLVGPLSGDAGMWMRMGAALRTAGRVADAVVAEATGGRGDAGAVGLLHTESVRDEIRHDDPVAVARLAATADDSIRVSTARLLADIYETTHDGRYYQPARDLGADVRELEHAAPAFTGHLDRGILDTLVHLHDRDLEACYELALGTTPTWAGDIAVTLDIATTGAVKSVALAPADDPPLLAPCVTARAAAWRFPTYDKPGTTHVTVHYAVSPAM